MLNFLRKNRSGKAAVAALAAVTVFSLAGCGGEKAAAPQATLVKSMQVIKRDTPLVYDYTGFVQAQQEMELKAQVSGQITGKYFNGGETAPLRINISIILILSSLQKLIGQGLSNPIPAKVNLSDNVSR